MKILIAGGEIGGLATALCLHTADIEVEVFEQAREVRELGVGINMVTTLGRTTIISRQAAERLEQSHRVASMAAQWGVCDCPENPMMHKGCVRTGRIAAPINLFRESKYITFMNLRRQALFFGISFLYRVLLGSVQEWNASQIELCGGSFFRGGNVPGRVVGLPPC